MTEAPLFEPTGISEQGVRYRSAFFERGTTDLGRRVQFRLKFNTIRLGGTALDHIGRSVCRTHVSHGSWLQQYDERLAGFVDGNQRAKPH